MKAIFRTAAIVVTLGLSAAAFAQSKAPSSNPVGRGNGVFFSTPSGEARSGVFNNPLSQQQSLIGRGTMKAQSQVTPVPEPDEWAMLLAGLALVGFIVRRNSKRS